MNMGLVRAGRICILGAGPAGVTAALALKGKGYDVTILDVRKDLIGGKCSTKVIRGTPRDVGAIYVLPNYPNVARLAQRAGLSLRPAAPFQHLGPDSRHRPFGVTPSSYSSLGKLAEYARLGVELLKHFPLLRQPIGEVDQRSPELVRSLSLPMEQWIQEHRLAHFREVAYPLMRSFGLGYEEQQIPAVYIFKALMFFARGGNPLRLWNVSGIDLHHVDVGYGEMWTRLAKGLDVRLGVEFCDPQGKYPIERTDEGGAVCTRNGVVEFDRLILACPLDRAMALLEPSKEEEELFSDNALRSFPVWQATAHVKGLCDAVILDRYQSFSELGKPMIFLRYDGSAPRGSSAGSCFYFFGYTQPGQRQDDIADTVRETIEELGGKLDAEVDVNRWSGYFPHYGTADVARHLHARIEDLQGQRATYYAGELVSGIGVEAATSYSERLVAKYF